MRISDESFVLVILFWLLYSIPDVIRVLQRLGFQPSLDNLIKMTIFYFQYIGSSYFIGWLMLYFWAFAWIEKQLSLLDNSWSKYLALITNGLVYYLLIYISRTIFTKALHSGDVDRLLRNRRERYDIPLPNYQEREEFTHPFLNGFIFISVSFLFNVLFTIGIMLASMVIKVS